MFNKIKEFFTGVKPTEVTQEVPLTAVDVAVRNIKETTESLTAKIEVAPAVEAKPAPSIAKNSRPKQQSTKAVPAPKKRPPAPK